MRILAVVILAVMLVSCSPSIEDRFTDREIDTYGLHCAEGTMDMPRELTDSIRDESRLTPGYWSGPLWDRWSRFGKNADGEYRVNVFFDLYLEQDVYLGQVVRTDYPVKWSFKALGWWDDDCDVTLASIDLLGLKS